MGLSEYRCTEHADEAAFLWTLRDKATGDWAYDANGLAELDERIEAHIDGLRIADNAGLSTSFDLLGDGEPGSAFVAMLLAVERADLPAIAMVLDLAGKGPAARELVSALGWAAKDRACFVLRGLLSPRVPLALHWIGLGACVAHRVDPGAALTYALYSDDERLLCRALRAAGQLGRKDLLNAVEGQLGSSSEVCRYWAAWSSALLGSLRAPGVLWDMAGAGGPFAERASAMAARRSSIPDALARISALSATGHVRAALSGAGALGEPSLVPWLLDAMAESAVARRAGLAFTMITGLDLEEEKLEGNAPEDYCVGPNDDPDDENVAIDPDASLPWPEVPILRGWWARERGRFDRGMRYLMGKLLTRENLEAVWREGRQPLREAAAVEMVVGGQTQVLREVRGRECGI